MLESHNLKEFLLFILLNMSLCVTFSRPIVGKYVECLENSLLITLLPPRLPVSPLFHLSPLLSLSTHSLSFSFRLVSSSRLVSSPTPSSPVSFVLPSSFSSLPVFPSSLSSLPNVWVKILWSYAYYISFQSSQ